MLTGTNASPEPALVDGLPGAFGMVKPEKAPDSSDVNEHLILPAFVLARADCLVSGVVVDPGGKPVAGTSVLLTSRNQKQQLAKTDNNGRFVFAGVCQGPAYLYTPSAPLQQTPVEVSDAGATNSTVKLTEPTTPRRTPGVTGAASGTVSRVKALF